MSIDDSDVVDAIDSDKVGRLITLTISDHLSWSDDQHLILLQEKLNRYLAFIESGEIYEAYPNAKNRSLRINIVCKYAPDQRGQGFLSRAKETISNAGFDLTYEVWRN